MSQNDFIIANQTAPNFRSDLNNALQAAVSNSSGATAPSTTYANMFWYDTTNDILKVRSEADDAWINVGYLDQSTNVFYPYVGSTQLTAFLDEDDMVSDSATAVASQQSIKAYVDTMAGNQSGSAPIYAARAWVNFNGTGTVAIRDSGNVSSITDNGTGDYTINFTTAMPDANYAVVGASGQDSSDKRVHSVGPDQATALSTTSCRVFNTYRVFNDSGGMTDNPYVQLVFLR